MPGLIRGVARTAVVAGTATAVSGRVARRQASRYADKDAAIMAERQQAYEQQTYQQQQSYQQPYPQQSYEPPPPEAAPEPPSLPIEQLKQLGELKEQGILTDEEFQAQKAKLLGM